MSLFLASTFITCRSRPYLFFQRDRPAALSKRKFCNLMSIWGQFGVHFALDFIHFGVRKCTFRLKIITIPKTRKPDALPPKET